MKIRVLACATRKMGLSFTGMGEESSDNNTIQERMSSWMSDMGVSRWLCLSRVPPSGLGLGSSLSIFFFSAPSSRVSTAYLKLLTEKLQDPCFLLWLCANEKFTPCHVVKILRRQVLRQIDYKKCQEFYFKLAATGWDLWASQTEEFSLGRNIYGKEGKEKEKEEEEDTKEKQGEVTRKKARRKRNK